MPAASNAACIASAIGDANGSSSETYAAVFGRCAAGRESTHCTNGDPHAMTGAGWTKKTFGSFASNIAGPPPAGSMNANPWRFAICADGTLRSVENGPNTRST